MVNEGLGSAVQQYICTLPKDRLHFLILLSFPGLLGYHVPLLLLFSTWHMQLQIPPIKLMEHTIAFSILSPIPLIFDAFHFIAFATFPVTFCEAYLQLFRLYKVLPTDF